MKVNRQVRTGWWPARQKEIRQHLTQQLQGHHRQASDWLNRKTKSWSKKKQQWFWGGWVGIGLSASIAVTGQAFHSNKKLSDKSHSAFGVIDSLKPTNRLPSFSHSIGWERVLTDAWRLDSLRRRDTLAIKPLLTP